MATAFNYTDTISDLIALAKHPHTCQQAVGLIGEPGCGKTAMGAAIAEALDATLHVTHPARQNPINYSGFPSVDKETNLMIWSKPEELHKLSTGRNVLVIDEIADCVPAQQSVMGSLALERCVNKVRLSDETFVILTANGVEHGTGARGIMTNLADRMMIRHVDYVYDDFEPYALSKNYIDPYGIAFLKRMPQYLKDFDAGRLINASPRSWEMALRLDPTLSYAQLSRLLKGFLPEGIVLPYMEFRQVADKLPMISDVAAKPTTTPVPDDIDARYVMTASLSTAVSKKQDIALFEQIMPYVERLPDELQMLYVHSVVSRFKDVTGTRAYTDWQIGAAQRRGAR